MALDAVTPRSRRAMIVGALGGVVALAAQALGRPLEARAANGDPLLAGQSKTATAATGVSTDTGNGFEGKTSDAASGVYGEANGAGGYGVGARSLGGTGILGITQGGGGNYGVWGKGFEGFSTGGTGVWGEGGFQGSGVLGTGGIVGVTGHCDNPGFGEPIALKGEGGPTGVGLHAETQSASRPAIRATATSGSTGVLAFSGLGSVPAGPAKTAVFGFADQTGGIGVRGGASSGRGGLFSGSAAQVRLQPSGAATHPSSGQRGDLFVDTSGRLWFCKGGTTWKQLA
jgi:hypothetical protein